MKMTYEKPMIKYEEFLANEFVAACGDQNLVYKFACTAGGGAHGDVFLDSNGNGMLDRGDENLTKNSWIFGTRYFHACGKAHEAPTGDEFPDGFYVKNGGNDRIQGYEVMPVKVWTNKGKEVHATEKLDINEWETAKS